jgi:hypothetical protein
MTMHTLTQDKEGARYDMGERNTVADMIEAAAAHIGAEVFWHDPQKHALRYHATLSLNGEEVCVEAMPPKSGARITSDDSSRYWDYTGSASLADAVKRRMRSAKRRDAEQAQRWANDQAREKFEALARKAAKEELVKMFGEELIAAAVSVDVYTSAQGHAVATVNVYVGKIVAQRLSPTEAVRFIQTMKMAGYDLIKENNS